MTQKFYEQFQKKIYAYRRLFLGYIVLFLLCGLFVIVTLPTGQILAEQIWKVKLMATMLPFAIICFWLSSVCEFQQEFWLKKVPFFQGLFKGKSRPHKKRSEVLQLNYLLVVAVVMLAFSAAFVKMMLFGSDPA